MKKDVEGDDGGAKQPAEEDTFESSDDGDDEQSNLNGDSMFNTNGYEVTCMEISCKCTFYLCY